MLKKILEQYRNGERGLPTYDELAAIIGDDNCTAPPAGLSEVFAAIAGSDHDGHAQINGGDCRAQPVAWVRYCSDGTFEGPIMDTDIRMAGARRTSGAWTPLYSRPAAPALSADTDRANELRHALSIARDHMRVMSNWIKFSDPAAYSWSCNAITIVDAVLERGEPK